MAGAVPNDDRHDREPISPELAMIDPELARRHALMPAVWETVRTAQEAARAAPALDDRAAVAARRQKRRWLLLAAAAAITGAGAFVLVSVGVFPVDSSPAIPTVSTGPPLRHASPKRVRPRTQLPPSLPAQSGGAKRQVARPAAAVPPATAKAAAQTAPTETAPAPAKAHAHQQDQRPAERPVARPTPVAPPGTAKAAAPAVASTTPAPAKPHVQPQRRAQPQTPTSVAPLTPRPKTFVWASVPGATEYHIAFFKGNRKILVRRTRTARLTVPGKWRYAGKVETFAPGRYRWYVWFARGRQASGLVVSSTIDIGR